MTRWGAKQAVNGGLTGQDGSGRPILFADLPEQIAVVTIHAELIFDVERFEQAIA
jgi:hypothetical protein